MSTIFARQEQLLDGFDLSKKTRELSILILSDLHFKFSDDETGKDREWREANEQAMVDFFKGRSEYIDIIAVAGDLSSLGRAGGYKTFIDFLA
jgi:3',5'-cyclic AMP phosphodiesterase CpdA